MADNKTTIEVSIEAAEAAKTVQELRKSLKDLVNQQANVAAGSAEWKKLTQAINDTEGKIGDLTDSFKTLQGSGVERVTSSFNLLKEGFTSFDGGKIKAAFSGIGAAMKAIPIFLVIEGIRYLIENFEKLKNSGGLLGKVFTFIGTVIEVVVNHIEELLDYLGLVDKELNDLAEAAEENAKKVTEALAEQTAEYDRQIAVAKANGQNTVELEIKKQQAILATNKVIAEQTLELIRQGKELTEEEVKRAKEAVNNIKNANAQIEIIRATESKRIEDENKKQLENFKKLQADKLKEEQDTWNKTLEIRRAFIDGAAADDERLRQEKLAADKLAMEESLAYMQETNAAEKGIAIDSYEFNKKLGLLALEEFKANTDAQLTVAQQGTQSLQNLSDIYFTFKKRNLQKGSAEEEKAARQQFKINKALQLTGAIIDGAKAITSSLAQAPVAIGPIPNPAGIASLALAITSSVASIAKIAATKYEGGASGGGGGSISAPSPSIPSPPTVSTPTNNISGTQFDAQGNTITPQAQQPTITVKAQVVESDMTDTQNTVTKYKAQSTF